MAEMRNSAEDATRAVPKARDAEPEPDQPAAPTRRRAAKAGPAAKTGRTTKAAATTKATKAARPAKATKTASGTRATKAEAATTGAEPAPVPGAAPLPAPGQPGTAVPGIWTAAGWEALRDPARPPHRLAELAVAELGPRAAAWAGWLRATYPNPPSHGIARLATRDARRAGWGLAATAAGGPVAHAMSLPAVAWVLASVVLRIAAAYGHDPTDPRRAGELWELLGGPGAGPGAGGSSGPAGRPPGHPAPPWRLTGTLGRYGLVRFAVGRLRLRRTLAGSALRMLASAGDHGDRIERLAHRAARYYRQLPTSQ